jgi:hypothetical protein
MAKQGKSFQTKLTSNDTAWKVIGRAKRREQPTNNPRDTKGSIKKSELKDTPPRETEHLKVQKKTPQVLERLKVSQDPLTTPLPSSPNSSGDEVSEVENKLIAAIKSTIPNMPLSTPENDDCDSNEASVTTTKMAIADEESTLSGKTYKDSLPEDSDAMVLDEIHFPPLSSLPKKKNSDEELKPFNINSSQGTTCKANVKEDDNSHFVSTFPTVYPPDWTLSPANYDKKPS